MSYKQYMRSILSEGTISFYDESKGYSHGQSDMILRMYVDKKEVGTIDYTVYNKEVSIKYIDVQDRRKGYGSKLVLRLQSMYPKTEIDFGMLTSDGSKLIGSIRSKLYVDRIKIKKLKTLEKRLLDTKKRIDSIMRDKSRKDYDKLNDLHDLVDDIEDELRDLG